MGLKGEYIRTGGGLCIWTFNRVLKSAPNIIVVLKLRLFPLGSGVREYHHRVTGHLTGHLKPAPR